VTCSNKNLGLLQLWSQN